MLNKSNGKFTGNNQAGSSMIEVVISILILTVGLVGAAAAITYALEIGSVSRNVTSAKSVIVASIEEIESLRNARRLEYKQIANVGGVDNTGSPNRFNGFMTGFQPVSLQPGPDGVNGTDDDLRVAGTDGIYGTGDDFDDPGQIRSGYLRQIAITNLTATLKKIEITVRYQGRAGKMGEISGVSYLNDETRANR